MHCVVFTGEFFWPDCLFFLGNSDNVFGWLFIVRYILVGHFSWMN